MAHHLHRNAVTAAALLALAGCHPHGGTDANGAMAAIQSGQVKADLQHYFDARRECAPVLDGSGGVLRASPGDPVAAALQTAGLIVTVPGSGAVGEASYKPAPGAERWFVQDGGGTSLCYARRKIRSVLLDADRARPYVRYTFVLDDLASWTRHPAVKAAVPQLAAISSGIELLGMEALPLTDGKVDTGLIQDTAPNPTLFEFGMNFRHGIIVGGAAHADDPDARLNQ